MDNYSDSDGNEPSADKPQMVIGKLKPAGVGPGTSSTSRKRHSLALRNAAQKFADQHGAELLLGIHTPTKKKKSWYLKPFGPRMSDFINKTAVGKKIQEACKQMSDSWLVDDMAKIAQSTHFNSDGPFISAMGEEAVNTAQLRGAAREKEKGEMEKLRDDSRKKRMRLVDLGKNKPKRGKVSRSGTFAVMPSPAKTAEKSGTSASSSAGTRNSPFKVTDVNGKAIQNARKPTSFSSIRTEVQFLDSDDDEDLHDEGHSLEFTAGETRKSPFKVNDLNRKDIPNAKKQLSFSDKTEDEYYYSDDNEDLNGQGQRLMFAKDIETNLESSDDDLRDVDDLPPQPHPITEEDESEDFVPVELSGIIKRSLSLAVSATPQGSGPYRLDKNLSSVKFSTENCTTNETSRIDNTLLGGEAPDERLTLTETSPDMPTFDTPPPSRMDSCTLNSRLDFNRKSGDLDFLNGTTAPEVERIISSFDNSNCGEKETVESVGCSGSGLPSSIQKSSRYSDTPRSLTASNKSTTLSISPIKDATKSDSSSTSDYNRVAQASKLQKKSEMITNKTLNGNIATMSSTTLTAANRSTNVCSSLLEKSTSSTGSSTNTSATNQTSSDKNLESDGSDQAATVALNDASKVDSNTSSKRAAPVGNLQTSGINPAQKKPNPVSHPKKTALKQAPIGRRSQIGVKKKSENDYMEKCDFPTCRGNLHDGMIGCDGVCRRWFHFKCGRITKAEREARKYYCPRCAPTVTRKKK